MSAKEQPSAKNSFTEKLPSQIKDWLRAWSRDLPNTWSDYRRYLYYSVTPASISVLMVALIKDQKLQPFGGVFSVASFGSGAEVFIASVGLCGTLMLRAILVEREEDREKAHPFVFLLLLAATLGAGFSLAGLADNDPRLPQLAICLFILAAAPTGLHVSRWATKAAQRSPVLDLRGSEDQFVERVLTAVSGRPGARERILSELAGTRKTDIPQTGSD